MIYWTNTSPHWLTVTITGNHPPDESQLSELQKHNFSVLSVRQPMYGTTHIYLVYPTVGIFIDPYHYSFNCGALYLQFANATVVKDLTQRNFTFLVITVIFGTVASA